ncbi:hypothetical protein CVT25_006779, partial [Psilocybe cyanescens]
EARTSYAEQRAAGEVILTLDSTVHLPPSAVPVVVAAPRILTRAAAIRAHAHQAAQNNASPSSQSRRSSAAITRVKRNRPKLAATEVRSVQYTIEDDSNWEPPESISSTSQRQKSPPKNPAIPSVCTPAIFPLLNPNHPHFQASLPEQILGTEDDSSPLRRSKRIALQVVNPASNSNPSPSTSPSRSSRLSPSSSSDSNSSSSSSSSSRSPSLGHISRADREVMAAIQEFRQEFLPLSTSWDQNAEPDRLEAIIDRLD